MNFSEIKKLENEYQKWLEQNNSTKNGTVSDCAYNVITFLDRIGLLKNIGEKTNEPISNRIGTFVNYKGYEGTIEYLLDASYYGRLLKTPELVSYQADTIEDLYNAYMNIINEYISLS